MRKGLRVLLAGALLTSLLPRGAGAFDTAKVGQPNLISAGHGHTVAVDSQGGLWSWGNNADGQLGDGATTSTTLPSRQMEDVVSASCGYNYTMAIKKDGTLWGWGGNSVGQLGNGSTKNASQPVKVMDGVRSVSCGDNHTAAITTDGELWMWGNNAKGQLGTGGTSSMAKPVLVMKDVLAVSCGGDHTAAIQKDGTLWTWGWNNGQLGNGSKEQSLVPVKIMDNVVAVSCGGDHSGAIQADGSLWTWGENGHRQLGNGTSTNSLKPVKIMDGVTDISCGGWHSAAVRTDGTLWTWGYNGYGQLGNNTTKDSSQPIQVAENMTAVTCGGDFVLSVREDGTLWSWGYNGTGHLGHGNKTDAHVPTQVGQLRLARGIRIHLEGGVGAGALWSDVSSVVQVPSNPSKPGYTFGGWYTDRELTKPWNFDHQVEDGLELWARWSPVSSTASSTHKSASEITVNGVAVSLDAYTLQAANGGEVTYVKLRDVAAVLDGTSGQFNVDWRGGAIYVSAGRAYTTRNGAELKAITGADGSYEWNQNPILFDGETRPLEGIVITDGSGGGHTFFKLRDLGSAIGFQVDWSAEKGIYIETK